MKKPNAAQLSMRDPALAALLGVGNVGADFGSDYGFGFGDDIPHSGSVALLHPAVQAAAAMASTQPTAQQAAAAWHKQNARQIHAATRQSILDPNQGSDVKVERYTFSCNAPLTLGTAAPMDMSNQPDTNFRPQRVTMNAPNYGFATVSEIKVANVSVTVGGTNDAYQFNANGVGQHLDMPTLSPSNRARVAGGYTGYVPPGFTQGSAYLFCASFTGPASIVA